MNSHSIEGNAHCPVSRPFEIEMDAALPSKPTIGRKGKTMIQGCASNGPAHTQAAFFDDPLHPCITCRSCACVDRFIEKTGAAATVYEEWKPDCYSQPEYGYAKSHF